MRNLIMLLLGCAITVSGCFSGGYQGALQYRARSDPGFYFQDRLVRRLAEAAASGDIWTIDSLLSRGVDVNSVGLDGVTPLWWAIRCDNLDGFRRLLKAGATIDNPETRGYLTVADLAAMNTNPDYLRALVDAKIDINWSGKNDSSPPLIEAARSGRKEHVAILIAAGADLDWAGNECTAAEVAAAARHYEIVYMLLKAGATAEKVPGQMSSLARTIWLLPIDPNSNAYVWRARVIEIMTKQGVSVKTRETRPRTLPLELQEK